MSKKVKEIRTVRDIIEERLGRPVTPKEEDDFNNRCAAMGITSMNEQDVLKYADSLLSPEQQQQRAELEATQRKWEEERRLSEKKAKEAEALAKIKMEEESNRKKMELDLIGETPRHKEIRGRLVEIATQKHMIDFSLTYVENSKEVSKSLEEENKKLLEEYTSIPYEYPSRVFEEAVEYRNIRDDNLRLILQKDGKLTLKNSTDIPYTVIYEEGIPKYLEMTIGNLTLSTLYGTAFYRQRVRIPIILEGSTN